MNQNLRLEQTQKATAPVKTGDSRPVTLFEAMGSIEPDATEAERRTQLATLRTPVSSEVGVDDLRGVDVRSIVIGLGFEERTLVSAERLLNATNPERVVLVRYDEKGYSEEIETLVRERGCDLEILEYRALGPAADALPPEGVCLVDITGLTKPLIFQSIRRALSGREWCGSPKRYSTTRSTRILKLH